MLVTIRPYEDPDFEHDLWFDSRRSTGLPATFHATRDDLRRRFVEEREGGCACFTATEGADVIGFIGLNGDVLDKLYVAPHRQGSDIRKSHARLRQSLPAGRLQSADRSR